MRNKHVSIGTTAILDCIVSGNPRPVISWRKNNLLLKNSNSIRLNNQMLSIINFQEEDVASYSCHATNSLGSASQSARLEITQSEQKPSNINVAIIAMTTVVVFTVTSFIWFLLICYCRRCKRKRKERLNKHVVSSSPIFPLTSSSFSYKDDLLLPELPKDYLLRCNGKLISTTQASSTSLLATRQYLHEESNIIPDENFIYSQQKEEEKEELTMVSEFDDDGDDEDDQHDSGVIVHYKSGSSLTDQQQTISCKGRPIVTINLKTSGDDRERDRDRRKDMFANHKHSKSLDNSLCINNNEKTERKKFPTNPLDQSRNYLTSSSGIESGVSSSAETISSFDNVRRLSHTQVI